ncbi:unnamed protein product [Brassica napus]|uniref:(rape) hypothetical protein n=1 Tax=Brassica napus TaxID=3708 RepID=A0A816IGZ5_BRANA|nr:unnamed protein product [Brassica napus]
MLFSNSMAMPVKVWNATWRILTEDILYKLRKENNNQSKAILSPRNEDVDKINEYMLSQIKEARFPFRMRRRQFPVALLLQ